MTILTNPHQECQLLLDSPITSTDDDELGRKPMVKNIVSAILNRSKDTHPCYTIGIYGKWGEGKTSVLEMVCEQIEEDDSNNLEVIRFNPWLFKDQESLLLDFFSTLQNGVTDKDVIEGIKQYGPLISLGVSGLLNFALPGVGSLAKGVFDNVVSSISDIDIDITTLKRKLNKSIEKSRKHLLIIIDDVDRLDKDEMHALFKLIRQNADFVNTTYMIAMDVDMVSKSIGERFENGGERAGKSFLEKIVQVPIYLPKIQRGHLHNFFRETVLSQIEGLYIADDDKGSKPFNEQIQQIINHALPLFTTVREIYLYHNSLLFVLPHIYREVDIVDICLLELLKQFHSEAYYLIRDSKHLVTNKEIDHTLKYFHEKKEDKEKRMKEFRTKLLLNADPSKAENIEGVVNKILYPMMSANRNELELSSNKRLCSADYFDKYFLYTLPEGIISDAETDVFIKNLPTSTADDLMHRFELYFEQYGYEELKRIIYQMLFQSNINNTTNDSIGKVCVALSQLSVNRKRTSFTFNNIPRIEIDICNIINRYIFEEGNNDPRYSPVVDKEKQLEIFNEIFSTNKPWLFHLFLATYLCGYSNIFYSETKEIHKIIASMISRFIAQNGVDKILYLSQLPITILFKIWKSESEEEYNKIVNSFIANEQFDIANFISKMIGNQIKEHFDSFCTLFDVDSIYERVKKDLTKEDIVDYSNRVGWFVRMYRNNNQDLPHEKQ